MASVYVNKPLIDRDSTQLIVGATLDYKRLRDGFFGVDSKRHSVLGGIKASGYRQGTLAGKPNALQFDVALQTGDLTQPKLGLFDSEEFPIAGRFSKFNGNLLYAQALPAGLTASLKSSAQLANRHLDGSEQMSLSGLQGVRGYGPELLGVDQGAVVQANLSQSIPFPDCPPACSTTTGGDKSISSMRWMARPIRLRCAPPAWLELSNQAKSNGECDLG